MQLNQSHASRACFVSGQQQHIFLPDLMPTFCELLQFFSSSLGAEVVDGADDEFPMFNLLFTITEIDDSADAADAEPMRWTR
ncbi:hypothetical protein ACHAWU_010080 [Discostella pseudostelligera]|uniref:Uncharacterized protein n=1 Tax=Discostella pseudostelligera TaxID=259834 RepID=A0ABD3N6N9_9STRA